MFRFVRKPYLRAAGGVFAAGAAGSFAAYELDEGVQRSVFLNEDLKYINDEEATKRYDVIHDKYADYVRDITYKMRGFYLKHAQLMSTQDDFVPKQYMKWVKDTQDNVPSEFEGTAAREYVTKKLREELGLEFSDVFESWDDKPLGVASIGQVHRAVLKSSGEVVAVKFLIPGIENRFRSDIKTLKAFCQLAMPQHVSSFDEIERQFLTEFDYRGEAENLELVRNNVMPKWGRQANIPKPYRQLCSKHILVMEFLQGVKLVDGIKSSFDRLARGDKSVEDLINEHREKMMNGTLQLKSLDQSMNEAQRVKNMLLAKDLFLTLNSFRLMYNFSLGFFLPPAQYKWTEAPIDLASILALLCRIQANTIFEDGIFNGDCHPGNILLLDDGRLGLIDYGQVKQMTVPERINYAKLIIAHARDDKDEVVRIHFDELGTETLRRDPEIGYLMSAFYNDRSTPEICGDMNISSFIDWLQAKDPMVKLPEQYIMASRANILLRGMGKAFGINLRMSHMWEEEARAFLKSQGVDY